MPHCYTCSTLRQSTARVADAVASANRRAGGVENSGPDLTSSCQEAAVADIPTRDLGSTGERVSAIGLGGWHLALPHVDDC